MATSILRRPVFEEIQDERVRESLQWMYEYLKAQSLLQGEFEHFELTFTRAITDERITHSLGFTPKDIIQTSVIGAGSITFNYSEFTPEYIVVTTTGAVTVRFFGGRYESSNVR